MTATTAEELMSMTSGFEQIKCLDLSYQDLLKSPPAEALTGLKTLIFRGASLTTLPKWLFNLPNLESLDLSSNHLDQSVLEQLTTRLPTLKNLNLSFNAISGTCHATVVSRLTSLNLSGNSLTDIEPLSSESLRQLKLSGNPIRCQLNFGLPHLKELTLGNHTRRTSWPAGLHQSKALRALHLTNIDNTEPNQLCVSELEELSLTNCDAGQNWITALSKASRLKHLTIENCNITRISLAQTGPTNLQFARLRNNQTESVDTDFWSLPKLKQVDLSQNPLTKLSLTSESISPLSELHLANCGLTEIEVPWDKFSELEYLDLAQNALADIELPNTPCQLQHLDLTGSKFCTEALEKFAAWSKAHYQSHDFARVVAPRPQQPPQWLNAISATTSLALPTQIQDLCIKLGAKTESSAKPASPQQAYSAAGAFPAPEWLKQWLNIKWPEVVFDVAEDEMFWSIDFSKPRSIPDFECSFYQPLFCLADFQGGNRLLLADLRAKKSSEHETDSILLFHIDHDDFHLLDAEPAPFDLKQLLTNLNAPDS